MNKYNNIQNRKLHIKYQYSRDTNTRSQLIGASPSVCRYNIYKLLAEFPTLTGKKTLIVQLLLGVHAVKSQCIFKCK